MDDNIDKLSTELFDKVLKQWRGQMDKPFDAYLQNALKSYNKDVKKIIEDRIYKQIGDTFTKNISGRLLTGVNLSKALYKNASEVQKSVKKQINTHLKSKDTIKVISKSLFDGYELDKKEILEIKKTLPKYLFGNNDRAKIEAMKIKTPALRNAFLKLLNSKNDKQFDKNMKHALKEKSRYYATRIADTEEQRAFSFNNADKIFKDGNLEYVKYEMSSKHPRFDICDYYANLNQGYGLGVCKKEDMVSLPLHPHCSCRYKPYYRKLKEGKPNKDLSNYSYQQKIDILGSRSNYEKFKNGMKIEDIFNLQRPTFPIVPIKDILYNNSYKFDNQEVSLKVKAQNLINEEIKAGRIRPLSNIEKKDYTSIDFDDMLDLDEIDMLYDYTGPDHYQFRRYYNNLQPDPNYEKITKEKINMMEKILNSKGNTLDVIHRGFKFKKSEFNAFKEEIKNLNVGDVYFDSSISSYSMSLDVARDFANVESKTYDSVIFTIKYSKTPNYDITEFSKYTEDEVLVKRLKSYQVVKKFYKDEVLYISLIEI